MFDDVSFRIGLVLAGIPINDLGLKTRRLPSAIIEQVDQFLVWSLSPLAAEHLDALRTKLVRRALLAATAALTLPARPINPLAMFAITLCEGE